MEGTKNALERFKRHMPRGNDLTLIVLKGHLLLEEILTGIIEDNCRHPRALVEARLEFYQKLVLAKALLPLGQNNELWKGVEKVNSIRNKFAHHIEPEGIVDKIDDLIVDWIEPGFGCPKDTSSRAKALKSVLAFLCGAISGARETAKVAGSTQPAEPRIT